MNGLVTRWILAFTGLSLLITVLPLLQAGGAAPLLPFLDRSKSHALYGSFLVLFVGLVLPGFLRRDASGRTWPWILAVGHVFVFAMIPLLFTAYISGVSASGMTAVGSMGAIVAGINLLLRRALGRFAPFVAFPSMIAGLFALPALLILSESMGRQPAAFWNDLSPLTWIHRWARLRASIEPWPWGLAAFLLWAASAVPRRWWRGLGAGALVGCAVGALPAFTQRGPALDLVPVLGGWMRPGYRIPFSLSAPPGAEVTFGLGGRVERCVGVGGPQTILLTPGEEDRFVEVTVSGHILTLPLPRAVAADRFVVLCVGDAPRPADDGPVTSLALDLAAIPLLEGALESLDGIVLTGADWDATGATVRAALLRYAALGGVLVRVGASESSDRPFGCGRTLVQDTAPDWVALFASQPPSRPKAVDDGFRRTFARPDWQEIDLRDLLLFAAVYHAAFLLAFLLPLVLDSRKSVGVYLVSVGFVLVLVVALAYHVLGVIFLRPTQVYTQSIALLVGGRGQEDPLVTRQILCFASMSAETRALEFRGSDVVDYRGSVGNPPVVGQRQDRTLRLESVALDRFQNKLLVRRDEVAPGAFRLQSEGPDGWLLTRHQRAIGELEALRAIAAVTVEEGRFTATYRAVEASPGAWHLSREDGLDAQAVPESVEGLVRKLLGHLGPREPRFLLIRFEGLPRPDPTDTYLVGRDLGAFLLLPL